MPEVLCFDCGYAFKVDYDTLRPTKQCPKCLDKVKNKMIDIMFDSDNFYKTQE